MAPVTSWVKGARCRQTPGVPLETPSAQKCGEARPPAAISRVCWEEKPFRGCPRHYAWFRAGVGWVHQTWAGWTRSPSLLSLTRLLGISNKFQSAPTAAWPRAAQAAPHPACQPRCPTMLLRHRARLAGPPRAWPGPPYRRPCPSHPGFPLWVLPLPGPASICAQCPHQVSAIWGYLPARRDFSCQNITGDNFKWIQPTHSRGSAGLHPRW